MLAIWPTGILSIPMKLIILPDIADINKTSMWRSKVIIAVCVVGSSFILATQEPLSKKYGDKIVAADLKENLSILASDANVAKKWQQHLSAHILKTLD